MRHGRLKIFTDIYPNGDIEHDKECIPYILSKAIDKHAENIADYDLLRAYYYNDVDFLAIGDKINNARPDKNNKISVPRAANTVTTINSYCFSQPFKFIGLKANQGELINILNRSLKSDDYATDLMEITLNAAIYGLGYRYVEPVTEENVDGNEYFRSASISPYNAFCVYANTITKDKVLGVTFYKKSIIENIRNVLTEKKVTVYNVFTNWHKWEFVYDGSIFTNSIYNIPIQYNGSTHILALEAMPYSYTYSNLDGKNTLVPAKMPIPVIEYERKPDRTNDFELAINLINAMNTLISCSVDCVEQNTDYILVFKNIDIGEELQDGTNPTFDKIKKYIKKGALAYSTAPDAPTDSASIDTIKVTINQSEITSFLEWIEQELEKCLFIPNRNTSSGGADTNSSVETRNGFRSLEDIAGIITANTIKAERDFLRCILAIARILPDCPIKDLKLGDIGIKPMRNKIESLINSTQAFATMRSAGVNSQTAYEVSGIVADPNDTVAMDEEEHKKDFDRSLAEEIKRTTALAAISDTNENSQTDAQTDVDLKQTEDGSDKTQ